MKHTAVPIEIVENIIKDCMRVIKTVDLPNYETSIKKLLLKTYYLLWIYNIRLPIQKNIVTKQFVTYTMEGI